MKALQIVIISIILCSCARILNQKTVDVKIITDVPSEITYKKDTFSNVKVCEIYAVRKKEPLVFSIKNDSTNKLISVKHKKSPTYWLNFPRSL